MPGPPGPPGPRSCPRLHRLHCGLIHAGVAHHVTVGKVEDDHVIGLPLSIRRISFVGDGRGTHLRLEIVGGHLGGGNQAPVLPGKTVPPPPLKKKVTWAYFSVSAMRNWVRPSRLRYSPKMFFSFSWGEGHRHVGHGGIVLRGADTKWRGSTPGPLEAGKRWVHQGAGEFPGPVRGGS